MWGPEEIFTQYPKPVQFNAVLLWSCIDRAYSSALPNSRKYWSVVTLALTSLHMPCSQAAPTEQVMLTLGDSRHPFRLVAKGDVLVATYPGHLDVPLGNTSVHVASCATPREQEAAGHLAEEGDAGEARRQPAHEVYVYRNC